MVSNAAGIGNMITPTRQRALRAGAEAMWAQNNVDVDSGESTFGEGANVAV